MSVCKNYSCKNPEIQEGKKQEKNQLKKEPKWPGWADTAAAAGFPALNLIMGLCAGTRTLDQEGEVLRALTRGLDTLTRGLDTLTTFTTPDMADN